MRQLQAFAIGSAFTLTRASLSILELDSDNGYYIAMDIGYGIPVLAYTLFREFK